MNQYKKKLSHRLFSQYFISTIIPVVVFSLISFYTVSDLLKKNATRQIYAESRAVGLTIYDRILMAESNLLNLSVLPVENKESIRSDNWLKKIYSGMYITRGEEIEEVFFAENIVEFKLTNVQIKHLKSRKRLLLVSGEANNHAHILMLNALDFDANRIIVAVLNPDYLWNITIKESDLYCVAVEHKFLMHCPGFKGQPDSFQEIKAQLLSVRNKNLQEIRIKESLYLSNIWDVFLEANFSMNSMSVIYLMPKKEALLEYDYYIDALPLSIVITLLLVFIISSIQMRRSLMPLVKLIQGAKNIISGDYTKTVDIKSNDEFGMLGSTFNAMVSRIDEQFKEIKALAEIDRLILSTSDSEYIARVLVEYIPSVIVADNVAILIVDVEKKNKGTLFYKHEFELDVTKLDVDMERDALESLAKTKSVIQKTNKDKLYFLSSLIDFPIDKLFICPIRSHDEVLGFICLGYSGDIDMNDTLNESLIKISDRAAVAFSNANWEKKLFYQARYDSLTKLPNRFLFQDTLRQAIEIAKTKKSNVAILFIDLDRFKIINDSLGTLLVMIY